MAANNKRIVQLLWLAAGLLFVVAVVRSLGSSSHAKDWTTNKVGSLVGHIAGGRVSMREHMALAESIWEKTVNQRHELIAADWDDVSSMPIFPATEQKSYTRTPYTIWDFTPASYSCPHEMERVGRMGDGGKWVCGMSHYVNFPKNRDCVIYSFGVRDESSFEEEMLARTKCVIWAYDFSVVDFGEQVGPQHRNRAHFLQAGIAGQTDLSKTPPFYSIKDLMDMNGHTYIDILKMDIEFYEFEALDAFGNDFPLSSGQEFPIGQLMVEIHFFENFTAAQYLSWWERLEARGLRPTWTEPNLLAVTIHLRDKNPVLSEYTMINVHDSRSILFGRR